MGWATGTESIGASQLHGLLRDDKCLVLLQDCQYKMFAEVAEAYIGLCVRDGPKNGYSLP